MNNRISELERLIVHHKAFYYQGRPEIPDHEYDSLEDELKKLKPNSFALSIVGTGVTGLAKVSHNKKMLSLDKTYLVADLKKWMGSEEVFSTFKIDGTSCSLIYERGKLILAKTRGDGKTGENITIKVNWVSSIPKMISCDSDKVEIRGELFATESNFFKLSDEMVSINKERPTSQRNIVAGLISRKDNIELCRYLSFKPFDIEGDIIFKSEVEKAAKLKEYGFELLAGILHKSEGTLDDALEEAKSFIADGDFQIDGIVFTYNRVDLHEELGETAHHPRYKIAFKFKGESKRTVINEIIWAVSRNGILTPVADVVPISLSGASISRVTLHNYGMVKQYNLKSGDEIEIIRSGEVIPKFLSVVKESGNEFSVPKQCPVCLSETKIDDIRLYCSNKNCPGRLKEEILNFIQKIGIDDLSSKRLEEMLKKKVISSISDLYLLDISEFFKLDNVKDKLANKLHGSIEASKKVDLKTFLSALGIKGGAYNKCSKVIDAGFNTVEKLKELTEERLSEVDSFAKKSSSEFITSLRQKHDLIDKLLESGFSFSERTIETKISGKKICITGSLSEKRAVLEQRIRDGGGVVVGSVSKNIDMLLTNDSGSGSSKAKKANSLGIDIISEEKLKELLK